MRIVSQAVSLYSARAFAPKPRAVRPHRIGYNKPMSHSVKTYNSIQQCGLDVLAARGVAASSGEKTPDAILCRSAKLHEEPIADSVKIIARAGVGVNNIPVEACTARGIVVCNTPGANANAVKELVMAGMLICARNLREALAWTRELAEKPPAETTISALVEKEKARFAGTELLGKTIGVIGLGAIGQRVCNMCVSFGMQVVGYDPYLSVDGALRLSRAVRRETSLAALCAAADYITIHVPYQKETKHLLNESLLSQCKKDAVILNFARDELVDADAVCRALDAKTLRAYATDFPSEKLIGHPSVVNMPHLGASTEESEQNCAVMASEQIVQYLQLGNIVNSVNFPDCSMDRGPDTAARLLIGNYNKQNVVARISSTLGELGVNIETMLNKHKDEVAYNIIDMSKPLDEAAVKKISALENIIFVRQLVF